MKILYVTDALAIWAGTERIIVDKANYLAEQYGYSVHIVTANQGGHPVAYPLHPSVTQPRQSCPTFSHYFWQNSINTKFLIFRKLLVHYY